MSEGSQQGDVARVDRIRQRMGGPRQPGRRHKLALGTGFAILMAGAAAFILMPQGVRSLLGFGTSEPEVMQQPMSAPTGINTEVPRGAPATMPAPVDTGIPATAPARAGLGPEEQARLAALEEELRTLRERQGGISRDELQTMLDAQAAQMRAEINQQLLTRSPVPAGIDPNAALEAEARQRMEEERARRAAIEERQIASSGLVLDESGPGTAVGSGGTAGRTASGNAGFLASAAGQGHETVRASAIADTSRTIVQGTILEGVLETAIDTDLPGAIRAVLSQDVLSFDGSTTLLPRGTRLIGTYSSDVKIAQRRVLVAWNRAVTPEGISVALGGFGADALGRSGQTGNVDTHFWQRFGSAALISVFGLAPQVMIGNRTDSDTADAIEDVGDDMKSATQGAVDAYLRIAPTINVAQGDRLTIFVNRDLVF